MTTSAAIGLLCGVLCAQWIVWQASVLIGWDMTASALLALIWFTVRRFDGDDTRTHASVEDPGIAATDTLLIGASIACLGAVALDVAAGTSEGGRTQHALVALGVLSVVLSWVLVQTLYTLRYARLFYADDDTDIDFAGAAKPDYADFAYLAFTVGMTYQVSDTTLHGRTMRKAVLHQALIAYMFGAVIVAVTINIVAGLFS